MTTASPTKLRDGSWGVRVPGVALRGQRIRIQTKSGKRWEAEVSRVVWTGGDRSGQTVSLCSTRSLDRPQTGRGYGRKHEDHEDCLSMGPCGPHCEYAHLLRPRA